MWTSRTASSPSSRSRPIRRASPASRTWRWPRWASTSSSTKFLMDLLRRDADDPGSTPRLRQGHHPLYRQARQGGRAPLQPRPACARAAKAVAYWRDVGTVDAYWEANIDLTDIIPELDLYDTDWPIWTYAEIKPPAKFVHDVGRPARLRRSRSLVSGDCIISGASLHRSLLFTGVRVNSYSELDEAVVLPDVRDRPAGAAAQGGARPRRAAFPRGWWSARIRSSTRRRFRRTDSGRLPDHPADDRPADARRPDAQSSPSPRRPTRWSRPAGSPTSPGRCRRRWRRQGIEMRTLLPGYPAVMAKLGGGRQSVHEFAALLGGPARIIVGRGRRARPARARRAAALSTGRAGLMAGRTARLARQLACASRALAPGGRRDRARAASPRYRPDLVHAHDWQAGLAPAYLRYLRHRACRRSSPSTTWPSRAISGRASSPSSTCRRRPSALDGVEYYGGVGFLKAGLANADRDHHGEPDLCRGDPHAGRRHGARRADRARAPTRCTASSTASIPTVWNPGDRPAARRAYSAPTARRPRARTGARWRQRFGLRLGRHAALRRGQPADLAEGHGPAASRRRRSSSAAAAGSRCSAPASRSSRPRFSRAAARHPGRVGVVIGYDEALRT